MRFEVFKRDGFQCQYCGKKSPLVVLEVDHVIPICEGGADISENLLTSCFDCNRGKGKELLETYKEGTDPTEQAILLLERERQLKEYNEVLKQVRARKIDDYNEILDLWNERMGCSQRWFPEGYIYQVLDRLPKESILEAIEICKSSCKRYEDRSWGESYRAYLSGIIRRMTNGYEGQDNG